jgi:hypothetical protein
MVAVAVDGNPTRKVDLARAVALSAKLRERCPIRRELLNAVVAPIRYVEVALAVERNSLGYIELAGTSALTAEDLLDLAIRTLACNRVS